VVSSMLWLHFTPGKDPVPILREAGWGVEAVHVSIYIYTHTHTHRERER